MSTSTAVAHRRSDFVETAVAWFGAAVLLFGAVLWADRSSLVEMTDFSVTYIGARIVHEGRAAKLYDLNEQQAVKNVLLKHAQPLIFEHPPFEALILSPLGGLSYRTAYLLWGFFNVLIWLSLPYLLRPYLASPRSEIGYLALWLLFAPLGVALYQGQSSLLVLLFLCFSFIALKNGHELVSGIWLGMALLKFQFAIPFALIFLLRRKWTMLKGFATTGTALAVLSFAAVGGQGILRYLDLLLNVAGHPHNLSYGATRDMATVQGFLDVMLGALHNTTAIRLLSAVISALLIIYVAECGRREEWTECGFDLLFAASIVVGLVASVHMFTHDLSPLVLATLLVLARFPEHSRSWLRVAFRGAVVILWIPPVYFVLVAWHCMYLLFPVLMAFVVTTLLAAKTPRVSLQLHPVLQ